jgi:DNA-3-methyladenine glycosylase II
VPPSLLPLYDLVASRDPVLRAIIDEYGYPPVWVRPNSYATLVLTILEQQVSLASAYASYTRLMEKLGEVTPERLLALSDEELRGCAVTRQKMAYTRGLAEAILSGKIDLHSFEAMPDDDVRRELTALKGIGNWTVDIYLLHALDRTDIFPLGDLALVNAIKALCGEMSRDEMELRAEAWRPYRSLATMLFWHWYIRKKGIRLLH